MVFKLRSLNIKLQNNEFIAEVTLKYKDDDEENAAIIPTWRKPLSASWGFPSDIVSVPFTWLKFC